MRRFASSIIALSFAFTDVDEVAVYRFDSTVGKISDFTHNKEVLEQNLAAIQRLAEGKGEGPPTPPVVLPGRGPRWLRWILDRGIPTRVLNDAVFAAAVDLGNRRPETRKIVIIISDGQATGAIHSLQETRDRLIQGQVQAYGVTLGLGILGSAFSILHTYADASGGDVYSGRTQQDLESALSDITEQARHQYVLSYVSNNEISGTVACVAEDRGRNGEIRHEGPTPNGIPAVSTAVSYPLDTSPISRLIASTTLTYSRQTIQCPDSKVGRLIGKWWVQFSTSDKMI